MDFKESNIKNNSNLIQAISEDIENKNLISTKEGIKYSTADLNEIKEKILATIKDFFTEVEFVKSSFSISASFPKQKVILEHNELPEKLIAQLSENFKEVLQIENKMNIVIPSKGRTENWNQLGAGLGLLFPDGNNLYQCTSGGIASKNGNYFIITAGHCFKGVTSTANTGNIIGQYSAAVGRQHVKGYYGNLDVGLVRITNNSPITRIATNKIKRWSTTEIFDGSIVSSTNLYTGMQICKTGITTNTTCGTVKNDNTTVKTKGESTSFNVAIINAKNFSEGGDSGGPVFYVYGNGPIILTGIVHGHIEDANTGENIAGVVTKYSDIEALFDINLYTSESNQTIISQ